MSETSPEASEPTSTEQTASSTRWRNGPPQAGPSRYRKLAIGSCLLATLAGTILAFASLPSPNHRTVLVSLYLQPGEEAFGVDAPHPPLAAPFLGLVPANTQPQLATTAAESKTKSDPGKSKSKTKESPSESKPAAKPEAAATTKSGTAGKTPDAASAKNEAEVETSSMPPAPSWHDALIKTTSRQQIVLHVSTMARIDQGQVYFYGYDPTSRRETAISLADLLGQLNKAPAENKLLVLEVHWPTVADDGDSAERLKQLNLAIKEQYKLNEAAGIDLLLSASDKGPARGMRATPQSLMCYWLTQGLCDAAADADHDGRISMKEAIAWAAPRIEEVSSQIGPEQRIQWIRGGANLFFAPIARTSTHLERPYPASLVAGWRQREIYLADTQIPWLPKTASGWAVGLSRIESGWRRGDTDATVEASVAQLEATCLAEIDAELARWAQQRRDSLRMAAARMIRDHDGIDVDQLAKELLAAQQEILAKSAPGDQPALIGKAVAKYVGAFSEDQATLSLAALIRQFDRNVRVDRESLELIVAVRKAWKNPPTFPITQAIDRLLASDASDQRIAEAVRLFRIHGRLGSDPSAIAILSPRIDTATEQFVLAQRLAWNPGMTSDAEVTRQLETSLVESSAALAAEESVSLAIRRLKVASQTISTDAAVGIHWDHDRDYLIAQRRAADLIAAISKIRLGTATNSGILTGELALLRQASEALELQLQQMIQNHSDKISSSQAATAGLISATVPAAVRSRILSHPTELTLDSGEKLVSNSMMMSGAMSGQQMDATEPAVCLQNLTQQAKAIAQVASVRYRSWLNDYVAQTATVNAIPIYRKIAQQLSIAPSDAMLPVALGGDLNSLDWDDPNAKINLHYQVDLMDAVPVEFEFLASSANCIDVQPRRGTLKPDQASEIRFALSAAASGSTEAFVRGIWLRLKRGDQSELIPLAMPQQPTRPVVDIDFGSTSIAIGRQVTLPMWPDNQPQTLDWNLTCNDPSIAAVVVSVSSDSLGTLTSPPIACRPGTAAPIRFPAPKPQPANADGKAKGKAKGKQPTDADPTLIVTVSEASKGKPLGHWQVAAEVLDPREVFELGNAEFVVHPNGNNELSLQVQRSEVRLQSSESAAPEVDFRLDLDPASIDPLIDFGVSRLQVQLADGEDRSPLFAKNLRFVEGSAPHVQIPVSVNGDPGYFVLSGRFPRQASRVRLDWQQAPSIEIDAAASIVPGTPLSAVVKARRLADRDRLMVQVLAGDHRNEEVLWQSMLPTSRAIETDFASGGKQATLQVVAKRADWELAIPTHFGTGEHRLRVVTVDTIGNQGVTGEHPFLLDDAVPDEVYARGESIADKTTVRIQMQPNPSGVASVSVVPVSATTDAKVKPMQAQRSDSGDSAWQLDWPKALPVPEQLELTILTNAGKSDECVVALPVQVIQPIGRIAGRVLEGSIAQPGLTVSLTDAKGKPVAKIETADDGSYAFSVPPGKYNLAVEKPATQRSAKAEVDARLQTTTTTDLSLLRT
ncbi:carboxypeptidase-like regulatory domain-containing protein [Rosistilla oblonga]|uniref:carboxypeptidase-like regulatory domain-containing protein n=1 Tax=Rosistilla oblonga TaxID=2527990 RepID=UPI003A9715F3